MYVQPGSPFFQEINIDFDQKFQKACRDNDYETLEELAETQLSKISQKLINSRLFKAVEEKNKGLVKCLLLNSIASVDATDIDANTPLHRACLSLDIAIIQLLINLGAYIEAPNQQMQSPLAVAISHGFSEAVKVLLKNGASLKDPSLVELAFTRQNLEVLSLLVKHGASFDTLKIEENGHFLDLDQASWFDCAISSGSMTAVEKLMDLGITPACFEPEQKYELWKKIARSKHFSVNDIEKLIRYGLDLKSFTPMQKYFLWRLVLENILETPKRNAIDLFFEYRVDFSELSAKQHIKIWNAIVCLPCINTRNLEQLLDLGLDIKCLIESPERLDMACRQKSGDVLRVLLKAGVLKNTKDSNGATLFDTALMMVEAEDVIDEFLKDPDILKTYKLNTSSASFPSENNLKKLIESPVFLNCPMDFLISLAKLKDCDDLMMEALKKYPGFERDERFQKFYMSLAKYGKLEIIQELHKRGVPIPQGDNFGRSPLHFACASGNSALVEWFLDGGFDCNARDAYGSTALHYGFVKGKISEDILELFVDEGFDLYAANDLGSTIFLKATAFDAELVVIKKLLNLDDKKLFLTTPNKKGGLPLHQLAASGNFEAIKYILDTYKIDLDAKDSKGRSAIHYVCSIYSGEKKEAMYLSTIKELVSRGCDIKVTDMFGKNILHKQFKGKRTLEKTRNYLVGLCPELLLQKDSKDVTPLHLACKNHPKHVIEGFIETLEEEHGFTNFKQMLDEQGKSFLHFACMSQSRRLVEFLIENGFDIHAQTKSGLQPMHIATRKGRALLVRELLAHGASALALTSNGTSLLDLALMKNETKIALKLIDKSALLFMGSKSRAVPSEFWRKQIPAKIQDEFLRKAVVEFSDDEDFAPLIKKIEQDISSKNLEELPDLLLQSEIPTHKILEFLWLCQNQFLVSQITPKLTQEQYDAAFEQVSLDVLQDTLSDFLNFEEIDPEHLAVEIVPKILPEWEDESVQITDLTKIISDLNITDPTGKSFTAKDLVAYFETYVERIVNEKEFTGTGAKGSDQIKNFYNELKKTVLPLISKMKNLGSTEEEKAFKLKILAELLPGISHCGPRWLVDAKRVYVKFYLDKQVDFAFLALQLLQEKRELIVESLVKVSNSQNVHEAISIKKVFGNELGLVSVEFEDEFSEKDIERTSVLHRFFKAYTVDEVIDLLYVEVNNSYDLRALLIDVLYKIYTEVPEGVDPDDYLMELWYGPIEVNKEKYGIKREIIAKVLEHLKIIRSVKPTAA